MGVADLVPGVSGGTVALLLGIHARLVAAVAAFDARLPRDLWRAARGDGSARAALARLDLPLVVPLAVGIAGAILLGVRAVQKALTAYPGPMMALFFGLILASVPLPWRRIRQHTTRGWGAALLAGGAAATLSLLPDAEFPTAFWGLLLAGAVAVTAMLLPGVSGSALLVLLGVYSIVVDAAATLDVRVLAPFAAGALVGLVVASRALRWLYVRHWDVTLAAMTGLLAGALVRVWPWRSEAGFATGAPAWPGPTLSTLATAGIALAGAAAAWALQRAAGTQHG